MDIKHFHLTMSPKNLKRASFTLPTSSVWYYEARTPLGFDVSWCRTRQYI